ncbi:hypothetical protein NDU88_006056 [Pleurodeles waltl]|uniref:Uncharacterized protein n=1 Tax=Pleurodeles waltl TaxID=8319 RepID=A0AAV7QIZ9_PLEWA|nr:hypothetical protein NDU88_006056 [Pleurodeles waltl]
MREDWQGDGAFGMVDENVGACGIGGGETCVADDAFVNEQEERLNFAQVHDVDGGTGEVNDIMASESFDRTQRETGKGYNKDVPTATQQLVAIGMLLARRRKALGWARQPLPTLKEWHGDMTYYNTQSDTY